MKIILGHNANEKFQILDDDGKDITKHLHVTRIQAFASHDALTTVVMECYAELEIEALPKEVHIHPIKEVEVRVH